jgi:hypothetical protein
LPHSPQALLLYFTSAHAPLQNLALLSQHTQALLTQWPLGHWLSCVQVFTVLMLLDEDAPPEAPPALPPPPEALPPLPALPPPPLTLLDELLLPALPPAWLLLELLLELPPLAFDELLLAPPEPPRPLELVELSDEPPEDLLLSPLLPPSPPPLSELLLDFTAQAIRKTAPARIRVGTGCEEKRGECIVCR